MKTVLFFSVFFLFMFSCKKNDSTRGNDSINNRVGPSELPPPSPTVIQKELKLESETLLLTHSGTPWLLNKLESTSTKDKSKIVKQFLLKSDKRQLISFKNGWQSLEKSKCASVDEVEILATIKVDSTINAMKYSEVPNLLLQPNQNLILNLELNNTNECQKISFEFGIISSEVLEPAVEETKKPPNPPKIENLPKEIWTIDLAEESVELSDLYLSTIPDYVRKHHTAENSLINPDNKLEQLKIYNYVIDKSIELQCTFKRHIYDTSGLAAAKCKMIIIPELTNDSIQIVRGTNNKSNLISINITNQQKVRELCHAQVPITSTNEEHEILNSDGSKLKIPRLKLTCKYDAGAKDNFANFEGVLATP